LKLQQHIAVSIPISMVTYVVSRSIPMAAVSLAAGVLLDLDHGFDYMREYGMRLDPAFFFHSFHNTLYRRVVIPLHGWEWLPLLGLLALRMRGNPFAVGALIGTTQHLLFDQFTNGVAGCGYFFVYRVMKKFVTGDIFPGKGIAGEE
jgi:hypothetical protein